MGRDFGVALGFGLGVVLDFVGDVDVERVDRRSEAGFGEGGGETRLELAGFGFVVGSTGRFAVELDRVARRGSSRGSGSGDETISMTESRFEEAGRGGGGRFVVIAIVWLTACCGNEGRDESI